MNLQQQLKKGVLEILVLNIISKGDIYGYDLLKKLHEDSSEYFILKEGSLYPILYRLEDRSLIESYRQETEGKRGVPRKYYKITYDGELALKEMKKTWSEFQNTVGNMLND